MAKSDATSYFSILSSQAAALLENGDNRSIKGRCPKSHPQRATCPPHDGVR
jgi:hypothetical protein